MEAHAKEKKPRICMRGSGGFWNIRKYSGLLRHFLGSGADVIQTANVQESLFG